MAHFYSSIQGSRGEATRCGTQGSGITGHIRGWNIGARVDMRHDNGVDHVSVYKTSGSNGYSTELIAEFDTTGHVSLGTGNEAQRLRDAMTAAMAAGVDVWAILSDEAFRPRTLKVV